MLSESTKAALVEVIKKQPPMVLDLLRNDIPRFVDTLAQPYPSKECGDDIAANKKEAGQFIAGLLGMM